MKNRNMNHKNIFYSIRKCYPVYSQEFYIIMLQQSKHITINTFNWITQSMMFGEQHVSGV